VIGGNADLCSTIPQSLGEAESSEPSEKTDHKVVAFSGWAPYLVVLGSLLDVFSTFFPWGRAFGQDAFLPFSIPLPLGWSVFLLENTFYTMTVNVVVRLASVLGFVGLLVRGRVKNASSTWVLSVSVGLSFAALVVFSQIELSLNYGFYLVLVGGILKLAGVIGQNVEIEVLSKDAD
jgi:hypothetical protein